MRGWHRYVALTLVVVSACSNGDGAADPPSSTAPRPTLAPVVTASIAPTAVAATTTAVAATTTTVVPTTTATTTPASTTTTFDISTLPKCEDAPNARACIGTTVPLPPDADLMIQRYQAFAAKHLEIQSSADNPDWAGFLEFVVPARRDEARAELEARFNRGEVLNVSLGVTRNPRLSRLSYPDDFIEILDCRMDGSYWTDKATGQPLAGEITEVRQRSFVVQLRRIDGIWYLNGYDYFPGTC